MKLTSSVIIVTLGVAAYAPTPTLAGQPSDWSKIPTKLVTLFYPGESTYQWLRTPGP